MSRIKEKPLIKDPKVIDKASRMPKEVARRGMDESVDRLRQNVRDVQGHGDTPEDDAADRIDCTAGDVSGHAGRTVENAVSEFRNRIKTKERHDQTQADSGSGQTDDPFHQPGVRSTRRTDTEKPDSVCSYRQDFGKNTTSANGRDSVQMLDANTQVNQTGKQHVQRAAQLRRQTQRVSLEEPQRAAGPRGTVKSASKGPIKTMQYSIKTTRKVARATGKGVKTAERTAKATAKAAKRTASAAVKMAKVATRAAVQAAKVAAKALVTAVKAIITAAKGLIAAIAAGGWVVLVVVIVICAVAALLFSPFGISANGGGQGTPTVSDAVQTLNEEFAAKIESIKQSTGQVDQVIVTRNTDEGAASIDNWPDILAVFAVSASMNTENPVDVIVMDEQRISLLRQIFWKMVSIDSDVSEAAPSAYPQTTAAETASAPTTTPAPKRVLTITVTTLGWEYMVDELHFSEQQNQVLQALMSAANYGMLEALTGLATGGPATDWSGVIDAPEGGMPIPLYLQSDYPQAVCYIDGVLKSVKSSGCGAASVSMVIAYLTGNTNQTPYTLFKWAYEHHYYSGNGLSHTCLTKLAELYGIRGTWIANDMNQITEALRAGHPVVAHMGPGIFTSGGHYIVLRGITEDGYVLVNDPGSRSKNRYAYPLSTVVGQARTSDSFMVCTLDQ